MPDARTGVAVKLLRQQGGNYFVPNKSMLSAIAINEAHADRSLNVFKIIFSAGNKTLSISIDRRQVPTNIVVARNHGEIGFTPPLEELENQFNKHATLLTGSRKTQKTADFSVS